MSDLVRRSLAAEIGAIRGRLAADDPGAPAVDPDPTLDALAALFGLSTFERAILVLCAAVELDGATAAACRAAHGRDGATFGLALAALPEPHCSALAPNAPLRHWRLVEPEPGPSLTGARLRVDERIVHLIAGVSCLDARLEGIVEEMPPAPRLAPSHARIAARLAAALDRGDRAIIQLTGRDVEPKAAIAATAAELAGRRPYRADLGALVGSAQDLVDRRRLWEREAALTGGVLVLDAERLDERDDREGLRRFVRALQAPCLVAAAEPLPELLDAVLVDVPPIPAGERRSLWRETLGPAWAASLDGRLDAIAAQFRLDPATIAAAGREAQDSAEAGRGPDAEALWEACRRRARPRLEDLAERIGSAAGWDDLVIPPPGREALLAIAAQVRRRERVYEEWGFAARGSRGLGISALFAGPSGTGKTMAAEVLANELRLDLFRIDLSSVVSKYIGETEKNLRRLFDAADDGSAVLLFDEADALFGRRTEVRDSHDRFANIEVSYLLQRMEAYRGLAILTTNRRDAIDEAFLRRIRFVVEFPFPEARERTEIWRRVFPIDVPREPLDLEALAGLTVAGGNIRNIALGAAFLAADDDAPVGMGHLRRAARTEYAKLERPLTSAELAG